MDSPDTMNRNADRALDAGDALEAYLAQAIEGFAGPLRITPLSGGRSNPTYLLTTPAARYALRRKPDGELLPSAHQIDREYRVMHALYRQGIPVPRPFHLSDDQNPIGLPFYVMEFLDGRVIEDPALPGFVPAERRCAFIDAIDVLAAIHRLDAEAIGLGSFGKPVDYYQRQFRRWASQCDASGIVGLSATRTLMAELGARLPEQHRSGIVHGDYRFGNLMIGQAAEIIGILDWELSTLGDPTADLAYFCLAYHLAPEDEPLHGLAGLPLAALDIPDQDELVVRYCAALAMDRPADWPRHVAFAAFRLAIITLGVFVREATARGSPVDATEVSRVERFSHIGLGLF